MMTQLVESDFRILCVEIGNENNQVYTRQVLQGEKLTVRFHTLYPAERHTVLTPFLRCGLPLYVTGMSRRWRAERFTDNE